MTGTRTDGAAADRRAALSEAKRELLRKRLNGAGAGAGGSVAPTIGRRPSGQDVLSATQERLWFMEHLTPGTSAYTVPVAVRLTGRLDPDRLQAAVDRVVARHEVLRSRFPETEDGAPSVEVLDAPPGVHLVEVELADLVRDGVPPGAARVRAAADLEAASPFDLEAGPVLRAVLLREDTDRHVLVLVAHHVVSDGWSTNILMGEVLAAYRGESLSDLPVQYGDYAVWQQDPARQERHRSDLEFWRDRLGGGVPPLDLPTDRPRPAVQEFTGAAWGGRVDAALNAALSTFCGQHSCTPYVALLAAYQLVLSRHSGSDDFAVGSPVAGRDLPELEPLVGVFVNLVTLPAAVGEASTFTDLVARTRQGVLAAIEHAAVPFEQVVADLDVPRDTSRSPLFQATFAMQNYRQDAITGGTRSDQAVDWYPITLPATRFDLELYVTPMGAELSCLFTFSTALFDEETVARLGDHLLRALRWVLDHPDTPLTRFSLLTEDEHARMLELGRPRHALPADGTLHGLFAATARRTPDAVAAVDLDGTPVSYGALNASANRLAAGLRREGVSAGSTVALQLERGLAQLVSVLGVLKAGCAYVPLDPANPAERLDFIRSDAGAAATVDAETFAALTRCEHPGRDCVCADDPGESAGPGSLAYLIYTSGSTGVPKGVMIEHAQVLRLIGAADEEFDLGPQDTWVLLHSYAFDFSVWEMWGAWAHGAALVLAALEVVRDPEALLDLVVREQVTVLNQTPAAFRALRASMVATDRSLEATAVRYVVFGGDKVHARELRRWFAEYGDERPALVNMYGITETCVHVTFRRLRVEDTRGSAPARSPIGRPLGDLGGYVVDQHDNLVPPGVPGELLVTGAGLARGYHDRPELTAERFAPNPFADPANPANPVDPDRVYRTGDQVRRLEDGQLDYLGRVDAQVKIRGFRIEPGEVQVALEAHPAVAQAVVITRDLGRGTELVGYVVPDPEGPDSSTDLVRESLRERVPDYMVPQHLVVLDAVPVTANGKVDTLALPDPEAEQSGDRTHEPPGTPAEHLVAQTWSEVLGIETPGLDDDFFASGGHSLVATQLVSRLRKAAGDDAGVVTVMDVFRSPTVRAQAALLEQGEPSGDRGRRLLYELTRTDTPGAPATTRTLVCVPYGGGSAVIYQPLADALPAGHALYAVATHGQDVGRVADTLSLQEIADQCVVEILESVQGPLALYGHCGVGATLIVEIARQLEDVGRELETIFIGAIFPFARPRGILGPLSRVAQADGWRSKRTYVNRLTSQGVDVSELDPEDIARIVTNMRHDSRSAEEYFSDLLHGAAPRLRAPIVSVVGNRDADTEFFAERYTEWDFITDRVGLVVLDQAGHYFPRHRAEELAQILTATGSATSAGSRSVAELSRDARGEAPTWWMGGLHEWRERDPDEVRPSMRRFGAVIGGQLFTVLGSAVTAWAIPLWIYLSTSSMAYYTLFVVLGMVPGLLIAPVAGALIDRFDRRTTMRLATAGGATVQVALGLLLWTDNVQLWHIYVLQVLLSITQTCQRLSYVASIGQLVPKHYLGHAMGAVQLVNSLATTVVPLGAVALYGWIGLDGIVILDIVGFGVLSVVLALVKFPAAMHWRPAEPLHVEMAEGFRFVWRRRHFRAMLGFFGVFNIFLAAPMVMVSPLVLSFADLSSVSRIGVIQGIGAVLAAFVVLVWGGPARRMRGILLAATGIGLAVVLIGIRPSLWLIGAGTVGMAGGLALLNGIYGTIVQVKVPQRFHGRVFAMNQMVSWSTLPIGFLVVAPLGTALLEPAMMPGGALGRGFLGDLIGTGAGRGMALVYVLAGLGLVLVALLARTVPALRTFDDEVPDAVADDLVGLEALQELGAVPSDPDRAGAPPDVPRREPVDAGRLR